ncbi:MAG: sporulation integral membrane protein YtvI [Chitinophagales bacterium]
MDPELQRFVKTLVRMTIAVLALIAVYLLFIYVFPIIGDILTAIPNYIMPFLIAILFAILLEPIIRFFQKKLKLGRGLSTLLSMVLGLSIIAFLATAVISRLITELVNLYKLVSIRSTDLANIVTEGMNRVHLFYIRLNLPQNVEDSLQSNLYNVLGGLEQYIGGAVNSLSKFIAGIPGLFILLVITTVATYFIAKERQVIYKAFMDFLPDSWQGKTRDIISDLINAFTGFIKAETILVSITGIQTIIGLKILGVEYALTIGILTGLLDIMPVVGPGAIMVPWIIWEFFIGRTGFAIGLLILYIIVTVVRQILEPRILGDNLGLHPLATLFSLYVGMKAAGAIGVVLGPIALILFLACRRAGVFEGISLKKAD